jgi:hypothetical protein
MEREISNLKQSQILFTNMNLFVVNVARARAAVAQAV